MDYNNNPGPGGGMHYRSNLDTYEGCKTSTRNGAATPRVLGGDLPEEQGGQAQAEAGRGGANSDLAAPQNDHYNHTRDYAKDNGTEYTNYDSGDHPNNQTALLAATHVRRKRHMEPTTINERIKRDCPGKFTDSATESEAQGSQPDRGTIQKGSLPL